MAKLIAAMLVLAYTSINAVRSGDNPVAVPAWMHGPPIPGVTKYCLVDNMDSLPSGEINHIYKNPGGCTCTEAQQFMREVNEWAASMGSRYPDYAVQCDESRKWKRKQQVGSIAHCVDDDGNQITNRTAEIAENPLAC